MGRDAGSIMRCVPLRRACLAVHAPQSSCSDKCRKRAFQIDVYGADAAADVAAAPRKQIRDPLDSFTLRSLRRDLVARNQTPPTPLQPDIHLFWPFFEHSHGDFVRETLVPLAYLYVLHALPARIGLSGVGSPSALTSLQRVSDVCTFERLAAGIPRCASACHTTISICTLAERAVQGCSAYAGIAALDAALGFARPDLLAVPSRAADPHVLRVLFARRANRRFVINLRSVVSACNGTNLAGVVLRCDEVALGAMPLRAVINTVRAADVFISMHGGDMIHALHLLPGRTSIELVNSGFERASWVWLNQYSRVLKHTLSPRRIVLEAANGDGSPAAALRGAPNGTVAWRAAVHASWNRDSNLSWAALRRELASVAQQLGGATLPRVPDCPTAATLPRSAN